MEMNTADARLQRARHLLDESDYTLAALGAAVGLSPAHLQRRFRAEFGLSPAEYRAQKKLASLKRELRASGDVTAPFTRPVTDRAAACTRPEPRGWACCPAPTAGAVKACKSTGRSWRPSSGWRWWRRPNAACVRSRSVMTRRIGSRIARRISQCRNRSRAGRPRRIPRAARAAGGQVAAGTIGHARHRTDRHRIPAARLGSTDEDSARTDPSYAQLAQSLGRPNAARAVARACAQNRLAVIVPCHRIIRGDGSLGGYRWGLPLKDELLQRERAA